MGLFGLITWCHRYNLRSDTRHASLLNTCFCHSIDKQVAGDGLATNTGFWLNKKSPVRRRGYRVTNYAFVLSPVDNGLEGFRTRKNISNAPNSYPQDVMNINNYRNR
ncbi:hypothetical protein Bbelb_299230 [Branchiostoma belcheri]|nr:hypothetical protein Bbelb_299230 [Branchiostoma belcheri]